jgi:hypothetical protein
VGIIVPCDPSIVAARIKRGDRRAGLGPDLGMVRQDLVEAVIAALERQSPSLAAKPATASPPGILADGMRPARGKGPLSLVTGAGGPRAVRTRRMTPFTRAQPTRPGSSRTGATAPLLLPGPA